MPSKENTILSRLRREQKPATQEAPPSSHEEARAERPRLRPSAEVDLDPGSAGEGGDKALSTLPPRTEKSATPQASHVAEPFDEDDYRRAEEQAQLIRDRVYQLEDKLHDPIATKRERVNFWCSPLVAELAQIMADQLGLAQGDILELALLSFYRGQATPERGVVSALVTHVDQLSLLVSEHTQEMLNLEQVALAAMDAERSPLSPGYDKEGGESV